MTLKKINIIVAISVAILGLVAIISLYTASSFDHSDVINEGQDVQTVQTKGDKKPLVDENKNIMGAWEYFCPENSGECVGRQAITLKGQTSIVDGGDAVMYVHISMVERDGKPVPRISVDAPLGTFLPMGLALRLGNLEELVVPFQFCDVKGCRVNLDLSEDVVKVMAKTKKVEIAYTTKKQRALAVNVPLDGIEKLIKRLRTTIPPPF